MSLPVSQSINIKALLITLVGQGFGSKEWPNFFLFIQKVDDLS